MIAKLRSLVLLILLPAMAGAGWLYHFAHKELSLPDVPFRFDLKSGSTMNTVAKQLTQARLLGEPWSFIALARVLGKTAQIKAGEYELTKSPTPLSLLALFAKGQQAEQVLLMVRS